MASNEVLSKKAQNKAVLNRKYLQYAKYKENDKYKDPPITMHEVKKYHPDFPLNDILKSDKLEMFASRELSNFSFFKIWREQHKNLNVKQKSDARTKNHRFQNIIPKDVFSYISHFQTTKEQAFLLRLCKATSNVVVKYKKNPAKSIIDDYYISAEKIKILLDLRYRRDARGNAKAYDFQYDITIPEGYSDYHVFITRIKIRQPCGSETCIITGKEKVFDMQVTTQMIPYNTLYEKKYQTPLLNLQKINAIKKLTLPRSHWSEIIPYSSSYETDVTLPQQPEERGSHNPRLSCILWKAFDFDGPYFHYTCSGHKRYADHIIFSLLRDSRTDIDFENKLATHAYSPSKRVLFFDTDEGKAYLQHGIDAIPKAIEERKRILQAYVDEEERLMQDVLQLHC
jgi:hypothetical protein